MLSRAPDRPSATRRSGMGTWSRDAAPSPRPDGPARQIAKVTIWAVMGLAGGGLVPAWALPEKFSREEIMRMIEDHWCQRLSVNAMDSTSCP
jgi:hypothetical protein